MSFSFLSAPVASASTDNQDNDSNSNSTSMSNFLNLMQSPTTPNNNELQQSAPSSSLSSGFSFMSPSVSSPAPLDLLGSVIATPDAEIKLAKVLLFIVHNDIRLLLKHVIRSLQ